MDSPLELIFKNFIDKDDKIRKLVIEKSKKLEQFFDHIVHCHVTVEQLKNVQHTGHSYNILIVVQIPGHHDIVVKNNPKKGTKNTQPLAKLVRETFVTAQRQVKQVKDKMKGNIKAHSKGPDKNEIKERLVHNEESEEMV